MGLVGIVWDLVRHRYEPIRDDGEVKKLGAVYLLERLRRKMSLSEVKKAHKRIRKILKGPKKK